MENNEPYKFSVPKMRERNEISNGEIRIVNLPVQCYFEWSDTIIASIDEQTGKLEYTSGFVMKVLNDQDFVYGGQETVFVAQTLRKD